jgi:hypothetical protein
MDPSGLLDNWHAASALNVHGTGLDLKYSCIADEISDQNFSMIPWLLEPVSKTAS